MPRRLTEKQKQDALNAGWMRLAGYSPEEIATALGISVPTVYRRLVWASRFYRRMMQHMNLNPREMPSETPPEGENVIRVNNRA